MSKHCSVACDTPAGVVLLELELPDRATIADALTAARARLGGQIGVDWEHGATGVYGQSQPRDFVLAEGDRLELYRPLPVDPRERRRARVARESSRRR